MKLQKKPSPWLDLAMTTFLRSSLPRRLKRLHVTPKGRLQEARDADLRAAMMTAEPSESGGDVESFFNAVDAQEVPQPRMDAFA